jgi:hypothetical protein
MSFALYLAGIIVVIIGVAWGLSKAGIPTEWIAIAAVIILGLGIVMGVSRTRMKDPPTT